MSAKPGSPTSVLVNDVERYTLSMKSRGDMLYKQLFGHPEMVRDFTCGSTIAGTSAPMVDLMYWQCCFG